MPDLTDIADVPGIDVWGTTVRARVIAGERASLALVELDPDAVVSEHLHDNEQLGIVIEGSVTFTIAGVTRILGPGGTWRIPSGATHDIVAGSSGAVVVDVFAPVRADWAALPRSEPRALRWPRG
ncbi:MAG: cupin domain-containing protein [Candidatus Limnocylindrales bacterium]